MAYDERLADEVRNLLPKSEITEKRMFGGLAFMLHGNMYWIQLALDCNKTLKKK